MLLISLCIPIFTKTSSYVQSSTFTTAGASNKSDFGIFQEPVPRQALGAQPIGTGGGGVLVVDKATCARS
jgi:hypothetical protein